MDQTFADALNELIAGSGISNNEVGRRVEVDAAQVGRWRKSTGLPRPENIIRLAEVFNVDYQWLMGLAYPESRPKMDGPLNPRLSALLAEIEAGWIAMDTEAERDLAERGARALFAVQPVNRGPANRRRDGRSNRPAAPRHDLGRQTGNGEDSENNPDITLHSPHPVRSFARSARLAFSRMFAWPAGGLTIEGRLTPAGA